MLVLINGFKVRQVLFVTDEHNQYFLVNGNWSDWFAMTNCSEPECGIGFLIMKRICNNPPPMLNGSNCSGDDTKLVSCGTGECSNKVAVPIIISLLVVVLIAAAVFLLYRLKSYKVSHMQSRAPGQNSFWR